MCVHACVCVCVCMHVCVCACMCVPQVLLDLVTPLGMYICVLYVANLCVLV